MASSVRNLISLYEKLSDSGFKGNVHRSEVPKVADECAAESQTTQGTQKRSNECSGQKVHKSPPAWVSCDDCLKWRRIPAYLADVVNQPKFKWTCKDNEDKTFADCSVPQEMTDEEIDTELKSYAYNDVQDFACINKDSEPISWIKIQSNVFSHRDRKTPTNDEIMVCTCMPPLDGNLGCGEECLNKMLNIECVRGTCPCGDICSNQQFQKQNYAKLELSCCGKKGAGLQLLENVSKGQFLIEYVGEVVGHTAYEARQRTYASMGHEHFYFMMLDGSEVIDACIKGNVSRFINHSCDPNCRSEKWMVNGEVCVGLFALRNISKGEEITFNYQYVPVSGAVAKRCYCGAANCRGYIGGNSLSACAIAQGNFDEDPKTVMVHPELEKDTSCISSTNAYPLDALKQTIGHIQSENTESIVSVFDTSSHSSNRLEAEETLCSQRSDAQPLDFMKPSGTMKKAKAISGSVIMERDKQTSISTRLFEIEGKLKNLLDGQGGIDNHKHATEYLKLLKVITAEGDNPRGVQRARGLLFMLDALLKTKSHSVLVYIISKTGLQMLHNVMKQNCNDFMRTPIIRKLLKVLEFLFVQRIITQEHITNCPYTGTESFGISMMALNRHADRQVRDAAMKLKNEWKLHPDENSGRRVGPSQQNARFQELESHWVQPSDVTTKDAPWSAKDTEADLKFLKPTSANVDGEAPPRFQFLCKNINLQNPCTGHDGASTTTKRPSPATDLYDCTKTQPARQPLDGLSDRTFQPQRHGHDMFGRCWAPWPQEENVPLKERRRKNSPEEKCLLKNESPQEVNQKKRLQQEESSGLKRPREKEMPLQEEDNWQRRPRDMERPHGDNWRHEVGKCRKRLLEEGSPREEQKWLKRLRREESSREEQKPLQEEENWQRKSQDMERPCEDNWRQEEGNWRRRSLEEGHTREEQRWLKRPQREESSREEQKSWKRLRLEERPMQEEKENWRRRPQEIERSQEDDRWKRLRLEEMPLQEEENWWRRPQEMERSREDDWRKRRPEKERPREDDRRKRSREVERLQKSSREEIRHWEEREHQRRSSHRR